MTNDHIEVFNLFFSAYETTVILGMKCVFQHQYLLIFGLKLNTHICVIFTMHMQLWFAASRVMISA